MAQPTTHLDDALQAIARWLADRRGLTAFHLDCRQDGGQRTLVAALARDYTAGSLVALAPTGAEAAAHQDLLGKANTQTVHRALYTPRKAGAETHFIPRGEGPLWTPGVQLVIALNAQRLHAREAAHLLAPGKPVLMLADRRDPYMPRDAFLARRTPDHTLPDVPAEADARRPHGRSADALAGWLAGGTPGSWLRLNVEEHDGPLSAMAAALRQHLPNAAVLGGADQLRETASLLAHEIGKPVDLSQAHQAVNDGRPLIVLSDDDTLLGVTAKRSLASQAPVVVITRAGRTAPMICGDPGRDIDPRTIVLDRRPLNDQDTLTLELENGQPTRIVCLTNDHRAGLFAGQTFSAHI